MAQTTTKTAAKPAVNVFTLDSINQALVPLQPEFEKAKAVGAPIDWGAELGFASDLILKNDKLRSATQESLLAAMRNVLHVGLTLNPIKHHCVLIPAWNDVAKRYEVQFRPMYRGLIYLGTSAGVHDITVDVVYEADSFELERRSDGDWFIHKINIKMVRGGEGNGFQGAYVSARMPASKEHKVEWVPADDIFAMRAQSDSYKDAQGNIRDNSPWVKWFDEQAKKSAINRASKRWEEAVDNSPAWKRFQTAVNLEYQAEGGGRTIEAEAMLTLEQIAAIEKAASEIPKVNLPTYIGKMAGAYGATTMTEVPAAKYEEILERVKKAKADKVAAALKGGK